jgi:hypothetical protein
MKLAACTASTPVWALDQVDTAQEAIKKVAALIFWFIQTPKVDASK